jgi:hypothetical protein
MDVVTNNTAGVSERKKAPSEHVRQVVLDMIDQQVNQYIDDRSKERHRIGNVQDEVTNE